MAGAHTMEMPNDGSAREVEVTNRVERLVAHELVGIAQATGVEDLPVAHHDGIVERAAAGEARRAQTLHFLEEAEGAGTREIGPEGLRVDRQSKVLATHLLA